MFLGFKMFLRDSKRLKSIYGIARKINSKKKYRKATGGKHTFIDRSKGYKELFIIIAGYKTYLYDDVFARAVRFIPKDMDVVIVSSGKYDEKLDEIAKENDWSYLYTKRNCVTLIQNKAIVLHPNAEYIYKMDEDIFMTEGCIETIRNTYTKVKKEGLYDVGFVAPLLPVNGYCHIKILEKYGLKGIFEDKFEKIKYASSNERQIQSNPDVAKFFWGEGGFVKPLDELNSDFQKEEFNYSVCPIRFSIGFILFSRDLWNEMEMFEVLPGSNMGVDEGQLAKHCVMKSKAMVVSHNTVCGHFSFGPQNEEMKNYYNSNRELFKID